MIRCFWKRAARACKSENSLPRTACVYSMPVRSFLHIFVPVPLPVRLPSLAIAECLVACGRTNPVAWFAAAQSRPAKIQSDLKCGPAVSPLGFSPPVNSFVSCLAGLLVLWSGKPGKTLPSDALGREPPCKIQLSHGVLKDLDRSATYTLSNRSRVKLPASGLFRIEPDSCITTLWYSLVT